MPGRRWLGPGGILRPFFLVLSLVAGIGSEDDAMSMLFGIGAPILLPILYGVMGLVFGFITAWLYNFIAKKVGGIEVEVE